MIPLILGWSRWLWKVAQRCGLDGEKWTEHIRNVNLLTELTAAGPIEVAILLYVSSSALCTALGIMAPARIRAQKLDPFAFLTAMAISVELYLRFWHQQYFTSLPWRCTVAYVSSNHFLFGLHNFLGRGVKPDSHAALRRVQEVCEGELAQVASRTRMRRIVSLRREGVNVTRELAGVGCMLKEEQQQDYGLMGAIWSFNHHRIADVWVHFGMAFATPYRIDHWLAGSMHLWKYSGLQIPKVLTKPMLNGSLSFDNLLDVIAHSTSGVIVLGPGYFVLAVIAAEFHRWFLDAELAIHHMADRHPVPRPDCPHA